LKLALSLLVLFSLRIQAQEILCQKWSATKTEVSLPNKDFPEVSGMALSTSIPGRAYFVNDSGDGPHFYSFDLESGNYQKVAIKGFKGWDIEAVSYGPCGNRMCVYVADVGDNLSQRKIIRVAAVVERDHYQDTETPLSHKIMTYPDEAKDAEGIAVTDQGDLYLFSKEFGILSSSPTRVYFMSSKEFLAPGQGQLKKLGTFIMSASLMTPLLTVTDAALSPDNTRLMLLGYRNSFELDFKDFLAQLKPEETVSISHYREVSLGFLVEQTESVSYSPDGQSIYWTYESKKSDAPLLQKTCFR
jgi:hypothetical protein